MRLSARIGGRGKTLLCAELVDLCSAPVGAVPKPRVDGLFVRYGLHSSIGSAVRAQRAAAIVGALFDVMRNAPPAEMTPFDGGMTGPARGAHAARPRGAASVGGEMELSVTAMRAETAGGSGGACASVASSHAIHAASRGGGTASVPVINCGRCPSLNAFPGLRRQEPPVRPAADVEHGSRAPRSNRASTDQLGRDPTYADDRQI